MLKFIFVALVSTLVATSPPLSEINGVVSGSESQAQSHEAVTFFLHGISRTIAINLSLDMDVAVSDKFPRRVLPSNVNQIVIDIIKQYCDSEWRTDNYAAHGNVKCPMTTSYGIEGAVADLMAVDGIELVSTSQYAYYFRVKK